MKQPTFRIIIINGFIMTLASLAWLTLSQQLKQQETCWTGDDEKVVYEQETNYQPFSQPPSIARGGATAAAIGSDDEASMVGFDTAASLGGGSTADGPTATMTTSTTATTTTIPSRPVVVNIPNYGRVQGKRDGGVDYFFGIPFASPPVGNLRFAPPEPPIPWAPAKLDATQFGPDCWQIADPVINPTVDPNQMSEDCLYLNIFTPAGHAANAAAAAAAASASSSSSSSNSGDGSSTTNAAARSRKYPLLGWNSMTLNGKNNPSGTTTTTSSTQSSSSSSSSSSKLLPVMVWFHGGAFQQGGARRPEYDGRRLAERNMVVVTFNYRLGALGFLVSSPDGLYGNFGLMDQRAVLHWIHENIIAFGGDPNNVTLFGESAGAVMIGLHLMMTGASQLFHKAILQSNPLGYTFRTIVVDDFIGEALKRSVDCRDLACLRSERVEEIMRAQSNLMGVPRSVGDFFTWGPTLTQELKVTLSTYSSSSSSSSLQQHEHRLFRNLDLYTRSQQQHHDHRSSGGDGRDGGAWVAVNVSQPLKNLHLIPDDIPILIGSNKHEGEMFTHSAFPITMSKAVYWMFVGALFRDSASRVLKHYRGFVEQVENEAKQLATKQLMEEENKMYYLEHQEQLDHEYEMLLAMNETRRANYRNLASKQVLETLVKTWSNGGGPDGIPVASASTAKHGNQSVIENEKAQRRWRFHLPRKEPLTELQQIAREHREAERAKQREEKRKQRQRERALKEAAKVVVDYRPVMSRIIDDYLFRCPSWHYAHIVSRNRVRHGNKNNVFVYRFSQPTHIPGFKECWGKSCHTAELPYVFQAMDIIRSNYSTLGPYAQTEAPSAPEYPYTDILDAYRGAVEAVDREFDNIGDLTDAGRTDRLGQQPKDLSTNSFRNLTYPKAFQRLLTSFFGDYFVEDADEEIATDMAERWAAFARTGDPNYDGCRAEWVPWRFIPVDNDDDEEWPTHSQAGQTDNLDDYWKDIDISEDDDDLNVTNIESFVWSDVKQERAFRRRALRALGMEVVEEDSLRTELRRVPQSRESDVDRAFLISKFLFRSSLLGGRDDSNPRIPKRVIRQVQRIAQDMGVLGTGLQGEDPRAADWEEDFFPELLELKWPPEGRLVERDCTCDMWDRIRYRY